MTCKFELIRQKIKEKGNFILHHIDQELTVPKSYYLAELKQNYKEEKDGCKNFDEYVGENASDYVDFAFSSYLKELIPQLCDITASEWETLSINDVGLLIIQYLDYFKEKSQLGYE